MAKSFRPSVTHTWLPMYPWMNQGNAPQCTFLLSWGRLRSTKASLHHLVYLCDDAMLLLID